MIIAVLWCLSLIMPNAIARPFYSLSNSALRTQVTCGSVIKLQHWQTGHLLHSHDIAYGSGSGQQSVTGFQGGDDSNSYWVIRGTEVTWPRILSSRHVTFAFAAADLLCVFAPPTLFGVAH